MFKWLARSDSNWSARELDCVVGAIVLRWEDTACDVSTLLFPEVAKMKIKEKYPNFFLLNADQEIAPCESTAKEVSYE